VLLVTLGVLAYGGIAGLAKYRQMVKDLDFSIHRAPRNADLAAAIASLINPLAHQIPYSNQHAAAAAYKKQRRDFEKALEDVRDRVDRHYEQLGEYVRDLGRTRSGITRLSEGPQPHYLLRERIRENLRQCEENLESLEDPERREAAISYILRMVAQLQDAIQHVPDPTTDMIDQLSRDKQDYRLHLGLVWSTSIAAGVMFLILVVCAHRWVVMPIYELQRGACRVAAGDFDYRIQLDTNDEMSTLAEAFNHMTERFQSVTEDL